MGKGFLEGRGWNVWEHWLAGFVLLLCDSTIFLTLTRRWGYPFLVHLKLSLLELLLIKGLARSIE
jgi:hypothetical protein